MNKLFQQLNPTVSPAKLQLPNNIKNMINAFKGVSNPQAMVQKLLNENPQLKALIEAANGNPEQAFRNMAKQMNVDPEEIINMLQ